ncbi:hypothetical protein BC332_13066 [Capsicum chinense]|nr:hypothetical protein BC332_13066 [Capsicum chinense]
MNEVVVVIVPFQAQGHLNQLLQFACLISSYGCFFLTHNASKVIEAKYLNMIAYAEFTLNKKQWAIAPILPTKLHHRNNICFEWLNKQPPSSVLHISVEKTTSFSDRQNKELAMGLEQSRQMFIWVLREIDDGDRGLELPEEFGERVKNVGLVGNRMGTTTRDLGLFFHGNVFLVMEMLKIGLITREWEKRKELVSASTIENIMRKFIASEEGDTIRRRADEMGEALRRSAEKEGSSRKDLDSFIGHITR